MNLSENGEIAPSATLMGENYGKVLDMGDGLFLKKPKRTTRSEKAQLFSFLGPQLFQEQLMRLMRWVLPEKLSDASR
jgi:hypothetical protein